jgi:hypothetical protein
MTEMAARGADVKFFSCKWRHSAGVFAPCSPRICKENFVYLEIQYIKLTKMFRDENSMAKFELLYAEAIRKKLKVLSTVIAREKGHEWYQTIKW